MRSRLLGLVLSALLLPLFTVTETVKAQFPGFVPAARYYGFVVVNGLPAAPYSMVTVQSSASVVCGTGSVLDSGGYAVDIQSFGACYGPLYFYINGQQADQTSSVPSVSPSGAVLLNLTVSSSYSYGPSYVAQPLGSSYGYGPSYPTLQPAYPYSSPTTPIAGAGSTVTYHPGWNLVAGSAGAVVVGATGSLFTFQPGDTGYEIVATSAPLQAGFGYWELFPTASAVTMPYATLTSVTRNVPPGQIALIGNPFARSATISGASTVYTYDPVRGYVVTTTLRPGQGAWAVSATGSILINAGCC